MANKTLPVSWELDSGYLVGHQSSCRWYSFQSKSALHSDHLTLPELSEKVKLGNDLTKPNSNLTFNSFSPSAQPDEGRVCLKLRNIKSVSFLIVTLNKDGAHFGPSQPIQVSDNAFKFLAPSTKFSSQVQIYNPTTYWTLSHQYSTTV